MKTINVNLYQFDELTDEAKEKARDWWRDGDCFAWGRESEQSIYAFVNAFSVKLKHYEVDAFFYEYSTDANNEHFRGRKLTDFKRDYMPTGYILDAYLWEAFFDTFKATGDAKAAFDAGLDAGFKAWRDDMAWQLSDEAVDECLIVNQYDFMEDGSRANI